MGMGSFFQGMIGGLGEAAHERNASLMAQEVERRKGLVEMYQFLYDKPDMPPEMKQKFLEFMVEIPQHPYDKKLPKQYTDLGGLMQFRRQITPPLLPPSGSIPAAPEDVLPFAPQGGTESFEYTPSEQMTGLARQTEAMTAIDVNRIQGLRRAGVTPQGFTPYELPPPVQAAPGTTIIPRGPMGAMQMGEAFTTLDPTAVPSPGSLADFVTQEVDLRVRDQGGQPLDPQQHYEATQAGRESWMNSDPNLRAIREMQKQRLEIEGKMELTPAQFTAASQMSNQFFQQSTNYLERQRNYDAVIASSRNPSAAGDISMIFAYMKILDPTSVVREGEQATAASARGVPEAIWTLYNRLMTGARLGVKQRADFVSRARMLMSSAQTQQDRLTLQFSNRAGGLKIPREYVVIDFSPIEPLRPPTSIFSDEDFAEE